MVLAHQLYFSIEAPEGCFLFSVPTIAASLAKLRAFRVLYGNCAWGASCRKSSELRTNCPPLCKLGRTCAGATVEDVHEHLEGTENSTRKWRVPQCMEDLFGRKMPAPVVFRVGELPRPGGTTISAGTLGIYNAGAISSGTQTAANNTT